jgi:hypothetical protein
LVELKWSWEMKFNWLEPTLIILRIINCF